MEYSIQELSRLSGVTTLALRWCGLTGLEAQPGAESGYRYCGGLFPGDQRGRPYRQVGNLRGREQQEFADDHPIKAIYNRWMNTIVQSQHRGKPDDETAAVIKKLAKVRCSVRFQISVMPVLS